MAVNWTRTMLGAAGAGGAGLDVDEVFSTYLYDGTGSAQTITNNIDLSGEGGLVWIKTRNTGTSAWHSLSDTERGAGYMLRSDLTSAQTGQDLQEFTSFNSNGFTVGNDAQTNGSGRTYASWTFRKAPRFFDVVTYTGNGTAGRQIAHNLGTTVGMLVVKSTSHATSWKVQHRSTGATNALELNDTRGSNDVDDAFWNDTAASSTHFTVGDSSATNSSGRTYVAYLFAHNNSDGEFGPDGDADIIKCGSYNGGTLGTEVNLGFEPQWLIIKNASLASSWYMFDNMRGITTGGAVEASRADPFVMANANDAEEASPRLSVTATGFKLDEQSNDTNAINSVYIYMAIRRGSLNVPDDATKVFAMSTRGATTPPPAWVSGFPVDFALETVVNNTGGFIAASRLTSGNFLNTSSTGTETDYVHYTFDYNNGWSSITGTNSNNQSWMWKRAPSYFDCIAYLGSGTATQPHSLAASPEMIWIKQRDGTANWTVLTNFTSTQYDYLYLNKTDAATTVNYSANEYLSAAPTATGIPFVDYYGVNDSNPQQSYIAYLFATVAGVSKVGSYTGNGSNQNIECGFSSGARFVLIKRTDSSTSGEWYVFDTVRGIVSGNDSTLYLNYTDAADTSLDIIDPYSGGFNVNNNSARININTASYIFYAIA